MLVDAVGGLTMARRRWVKVLLVAVMIALPSAVIAVIASEVVTEVDLARASVTLVQRHAVSFTANDADVDTPSLDLTSLQTEIAADRAYTTVLFSAGLDGGYTSDGHPLVYVIGDAARRLFPALRLCHPAPCVMRGHDLRDAAISENAFGSVRREGQDVLPRGAALLTMNAGGKTRLDDTVVLVLPASVVTEMSTHEGQEAASSVVLLDPTPRTIDRYVDSMARQTLNVVPRYLDTPQGGLHSSLAESGIFLMGFAAFLFLVLMAFGASVIRLVDQERRSLTIRRTYGATARGTRMRLATFLACVGVGPVAVLLGLRWLGDSAVTSAGLVVLAVSALFWVTLWARACRASAPDDAPLGAGDGL